MDLDDARRTRFHAAARALGATGPTEEVFQALLAAYAEPHRAYHAQSHIDHCLTLLEEHRGALARPDEIALALWFHDVVYSTQPGATNEADSARIAADACRAMGITAEHAARIDAMIRATQTHALPPGVTDADVDFTTMLDVDLSILGESPTTYAAFERDVRKEYAWVPEPLYVEGRAKVLRTFLERPRIYRTPTLHARYDAQARTNLAAALTALTRSAP